MIAIIGTAGRDKSKPMTLQLWHWMLEDARKRIPKNSCLVSGGAAWADHIAVELFRTGHAKELTLHLPAPMGRLSFIGPYRSAGAAANHYHSLFSKVIGDNSIAQIYEVSSWDNCHGTYEPAAEGYGAMFARNLKVARDADQGVLAYTFGPGDVPVDGGTKNTWDQCRGEKLHVSLPYLSRE